jgi:hypothetical protein
MSMATRLPPARAPPSRGAEVHGDERAQLTDLAGVDAARRQQASQGACDDRQRDVVQRASERAPRAFEIVERQRHACERTVGPDGVGVEGRGARFTEGAERALGHLEATLERGAHLAAAGGRELDEALLQDRQLLHSALEERSHVVPRGGLLDARRRSAGAREGHRLEREERGEQPHARDAVEHRVVGLRDDREATALEPLDEPHLPEGALAIETLREHATRERVQLLDRAGPRDGRVSDVEVEIEVGIRAPDRAEQREEPHSLAEARDRAEALGDGVADREGVERAVRPDERPAFEDRDGSHVHVQRSGLDREERAVEGAQAIDGSGGHQVLLGTARRLFNARAFE